jgi:putative alpha-1,2-mannosidase
VEKYGSGLGTNKVLHFYSDLSFWDTFRGAHPWQLLTDESLAVGVLRSVSEMTVQQNAFPRWVLASEDISCMVGLHGGALAVEAALAGLGAEFDLRGIQQMLQQQATQEWPKNGRADLDFYLENGYVSSEANDHR